MISQAVIHVNARLKDQVLKFAMSKTDSVLAIPNMEDVNVINVPLDFSIILLVILVVAISKFEWYLKITLLEGSVVPTIRSVPPVKSAQLLSEIM